MSDVFTPVTPREAFEVTTCHGKEKYPSPQLAHRRLAEMARKSKRHRRSKKSAKRAAYRCTVCNHWHLGSVK